MDKHKIQQIINNVVDNTYQNNLQKLLNSLNESISNQNSDTTNELNIYLVTLQHIYSDMKEIIAESINQILNEK